MSAGAAEEQGAAASAGQVTVRYWAAARAAAGVERDRFPVTGAISLVELLALVRERHEDRPKLADVIAVCSVLVGDRPVGAADPAQVQVQPGEIVELLPPFAGG